MEQVSKQEGLTHHEAMIALTVRFRQFEASAAELSHWNEALEFSRQDDVTWPDGDQIWLRAKQYPVFFEC